MFIFAAGPLLIFATVDGHMSSNISIANPRVFNLNALFVKAFVLGKVSILHEHGQQCNPEEILLPDAFGDPS